MLLATGKPLLLGVTSGSRLRFAKETKPDDRGVGSRLLFLDDAPAFELSLWCGTCPCLFKRLEGATSTCAIESLGARLADGLDAVDDETVSQYGRLLPQGRYLPLLVQIAPRLVHPSRPGDYFAEEQLATWGLNGFWGLPEHPQVSYYRTFETAVTGAAHLFEFVAPMVPPTWNDPARVEHYRARLAGSARPTCVAVSTLDVCQPAEARSDHYYAHWGLTHFLLDGHHKIHAAAEARRPLRLLSLLSLDGSLADLDQAAQLPEIRARRHESRSPAQR